MDHARNGASEYEAEPVMATPDISDELAETDWPAEPATSEPSRS